MHFVLISHTSPYYNQAKHLRDEIMRKPLGMRLSEKDIAGEEQQLHFGALDGKGALVATIILKPLSEELGKLRQMAVAAHMQGRGIGRQLIQFAEKTAREQGFKRIELNARQSAQGFYEKLGYHPEGEAFIEIGIPHIHMTKAL